ncbi:MAG: SpoIID/LytB domain-containing protein [Candidatus Riflebacteria bacterium]|nr:SpoIID/LytB domain-containing protein [Candidatus Riflebacteria bacterium]
MKLVIWRAFLVVPVLFFAVCVFAKVPDIKIKVAEYDSKISFSMPEGGKWSFGDKSGLAKANDKFLLTAKLKKPSCKKFHVMVESVPLRDQAKLEAALAKWRSGKRAVNTLTIGKITYSADGVTPAYDGRVLYIGQGTFADRETAQKLSDQLAAESCSNWIFEEIITLSAGTMELKKNGKKLLSGNIALELFPAKSVRLENVEHAKGYSWHGFETRIYAGNMKFSWGGQNFVDCILTTDMESLLAGVVPAEISSRAEPAALQAQAVAARGEILGKIALSHYNEGFDCCAEQHCQVYKGERSETERMRSAILPTRGMLLNDSSGSIVDAVYSANCGGHTESNHLVWTSQPNPILEGTWDTVNACSLNLTNETDVASYIRFPPDSFCSDKTVEGGDKFRWSKSLGSSEIKDVEKKLQIGRIKDCGDVKRGPSGRIYSITFNGENGNKTVIKELAIRKLFGGLRSACFIVSWKKDAEGYFCGAEFIGAGWGHGVGMCQSGAQSMAKRGFKFSEILSHYFPGSLLKRKY